jgi:hypothetical protein
MKKCRAMRKCNDSVVRRKQPDGGETMATPLRRLRVRADYGHGRKQANADAWLTALETRYAENMAATGQLVQAMSHADSNDGRSFADANENLVNAMEVRHSERWLATQAATFAWPTPWDDTCTSIAADGTRTTFVVPEPEPMDDRMAALVASLKAESIADAADARGARRRY